MSPLSNSAVIQPFCQPVPANRISFNHEDREWITDRIDEILECGQLMLGRYGEALENQFAKLCGRKHGIAVNSGTAALEITLRCLGVEGKDVLVPTNTFFATVAAVIRAGARPVFVDTDPQSFGTSIDEVKRRLTRRTVGVIAVHIGGVIDRNTRALADYLQNRGLWLVEDAAHAQGCALNGRSAGAFGIAGVFSFCATKVMTSGEGGMIVTDDARLAAEARVYRDQGKADLGENTHVNLGYNWRLPETSAVVGLRQLTRLPAIIQARQSIARFYDEGLAQQSILQPLQIPQGVFTNYYKYIALLPPGIDRQELKADLKRNFGVSLAGEVYATPAHRQPVFKSFVNDRLPNAEDLCARHICLPVFPTMTEPQMRQVIDALSKAL